MTMMDVVRIDTFGSREMRPLSAGPLVSMRWDARSVVADNLPGAILIHVACVRRKISGPGVPGIVKAASPATLITFDPIGSTTRSLKVAVARAATQAGLALDPSFTIRRYRGVTALSDNPIFVSGRTIEGMRLAGVPEG